MLRDMGGEGTYGTGWEGICKRRKRYGRRGDVAGEDWKQTLLRMDETNPIVASSHYF